MLYDILHYSNNEMSTTLCFSSSWCTEMKLSDGPGDTNENCFLELDSHVHARGADFNMAIMLDALEDMMQHIDATLFLDYYKPIRGIHVARYVTAWIDPDMEKIWTICFHQAVHFIDKLKHGLISYPYQIRACLFHRIEVAPR